MGIRKGCSYYTRKSPSSHSTCSRGSLSSSQKTELAAALVGCNLSGVRFIFLRVEEGWSRLPSLGLRSGWHSAQVGEHGGAGFDAHEEARDLHILIGGVVGLVSVGVGNAKGRNAERFGEDVIGQAGSLGRYEERRSTLGSDNGQA